MYIQGMDLPLVSSCWGGERRGVGGGGDMFAKNVYHIFLDSCQE